MYEQVEGLDVHEADDGLILFNPETDCVHHLNSSAGVLFVLCDQPRSRESLINSFNALYGLDNSSDDSIQTTLDQLTQQRVLVKSTGS